MQAHAQIYIQDAAAQERDKYSEIWSLQEYRNAHSPGLENVERFMSWLRPKSGAGIFGGSIIDIGCGQGQSVLEFQARGLTAWGLDITSTALDPTIDRARFIETPLWDPNWPKQGPWNFGFCCDVLEHIPPEYAMLTVDRILDACGIAWLQIANGPDNFGPKLLGESLHLTVQPFKWWLLRIATLGEVIDARDLCGASVFVVSRKSSLA